MPVGMFQYLSTAVTPSSSSTVSFGSGKYRTMLPLHAFRFLICDPEPLCGPAPTATVPTGCPAVVANSFKETETSQQVTSQCRLLIFCCFLEVFGKCCWLESLWKPVGATGDLLCKNGDGNHLCCLRCNADDTLKLQADQFLRQAENCNSPSPSMLFAVCSSNIADGKFLPAGHPCDLLTSLTRLSLAVYAYWVHPSTSHDCHMLAVHVWLVLQFSRYQTY